MSCSMTTTQDSFHTHVHVHIEKMGNLAKSKLKLYICEAGSLGFRKFIRYIKFI